MHQKTFLIIFFMLCSLLRPAWAQDYTIVIKGGHLIDPKNNINEVMDVAIQDDKIVLVAKNIDAKQARVIDAKGLYVTPGFIDIHSHNFHGTKEDHYLGDGLEALPPDGFTFRSGVTTVVDAGGAGWKTFSTFKEQTIDHSKTRVLSFLNIVGEGMRGGAYEQNMSDMDAKMTAMVVGQHKEEIVGIKVAHYSGPEWDPVDRAVAAGKIANVPVMVDFGGTTPPLSIQDLFMKHLRPGDIFTHTFAQLESRIAIVDGQGKLRPYVTEAQKRGIVFDVGHGGGSFRFSQAIPALKSGFIPNTISTDYHTGSMNGGMKDQSNVMSKFLNMGMSIQQVAAASTWIPAQVIHREDLGHLSAGAGADVAIFGIRKGKFGFVDSSGFKMDGDQKLECELTIRDGKVVYDLNGISSPYWDK
ncbi:MAG: amidohydrolase/deacetylase family metallohydrolase [Cyclobacteriaceae bacterium]|nr:amidohydrolase/deacetylase family metallohydrolase [Cyclobacteriaceae bacterium]MDH5249791.1 amidohydrolase/deacetylase family metallohydrolase [Cyclobacteriaceae bacterium]